MATRKSHQKTRYGCSPCKKRRIKCDQNQPSCQNCAKRGLDCSYYMIRPVSGPSIAPFATQENKPSATVQILDTKADILSPPLSPSLPFDIIESIYPSCSDLLRRRFRELIHHFEVRTSSTLATDPPAQRVWKTVVPTLAAVTPCILHGIIAVSAMHFARSLSNGKEKDIYLQIAAAQMNIGLSQYRTGLEDITEDNAEALFAFSVLTTTYVWVTATDECREVLSSLKLKGLCVERKEEVKMKLSSMMTKTLRALRGCLVILTPCWTRVSTGVLSAIVNRSWWPQSRYPTSPLAIEEDRMVHSIERMWVRPGRRYEYCLDTLASSLKLLREVFALVSLLTMDANACGDPTPTGTLTDRGAMFVWPTQVSLDFVSLLEQNRPEAWVILAHFAILPGRVKGVWWLDGMASPMVAAAALIAGKESRNFIEWPMREVGGDLDEILSS
ncbi:hypothetical protein BCR34DRAFT_42046 [Clohesyomyces aquaticus]|uniref:Zn(2)-C6 fungal-type domain-containing protein n=1 Tax=Clohesyomyces aquaticus TaxID=1231657 RepID=A0A1Y1Z701_9PLEO|nr:hypothetical protein BCR34DRAFT_42046 [Clohesyomyces aquaticus]